jgi:hypothetical protein
MTPRDASSRRARTVVLLLVAVGAILAAIGLSRRLLTPPPRPTAAARLAIPAVAPATAHAGGVEVTAATGTVEAQHDGRWLAVKPGDTVGSTDVVRTAPGATAVLRINAGTEIELRPGVEIGLGALGPEPAPAPEGGPDGGGHGAGAHVSLRRGKLLARVAGSDELAVTARDTRTTNSGPARFVVQADEKGRVSVAALAGNARFTAAGKSIALPEGTISAASAGAPPQDPERIPAEVLLNVAWPTPDRRDAEAAIGGHAAPASTITVRSGETTRTATTGPDGRFSIAVPMRGGKIPVEVEAEDLPGRTRQVSATVSRRGPPPALKAETTDLWKR